MSPPKYSSRYPEIREVLDYAIANRGARYTLISGGKAVHWRQRAYHFRKILWGELNGMNPVPPIPTPYDGLRITVDPTDPTTVIIEINSADRIGTLVPLSPEIEPITDPLMIETLALKKKLFGEK